MTQRNYASIITNQSITVHTPSGRAFTWQNDHPNFDNVKDAIRCGEDVTVIEGYMDVRAAIIKATAAYGNVSVRGDNVYYKDRPIHGTITERILQHLREDLPVEPLLAFADNLFQNQRKSAVESLYDFLEANKIPFTDDGHFLVYKKVNDEYRDYYTGTFDNSVGTVVRVEPNEVEEDRDMTCSNGLHVCARHYLPAYYGGTGHVMICKVNPAHVVAVPRDYNNSKMRVYQYEVIGELNEEAKADIFDKVIYVDPADAPLSDDVNWGENFVGNGLDGADDDDEGYDPPQEDNPDPDWPR